MFAINLKVIVAMVTKLCTHSISAMAMHAMLLRFACYIPVLILKSQRHNFSQTNNFSQIIKFGVVLVFMIKMMTYPTLYICLYNHSIIHTQQRLLENSD